MTRKMAGKIDGFFTWLKEVFQKKNRFFKISMSKVIIERGLPSGGTLLIVLAAFLTPAAGGFSGKAMGQDKPDTSRFYARQVVYENKVLNAKDSLGAPDGSYAEILPGGQLAILMENILLPSRISGYGENAGCVDSGSVVGKGEADFGLEGRFTWQDAQGEQHHEWISLGPTATGFCFSPPLLAVCSFKDSSGVDIVRITNSGTKSLFIDAVIGYADLCPPEFDGARKRLAGWKGGRGIKIIGSSARL